MAVGFMANSSLSGQRLGAYDVGPMLGVGGMGEVYRARDSKLNRDVAIKVLLPEVANDAERLARFRREAQTLASLNHSGIAQIHGLEDSSNGPFLVMELVDGPTLADRIAGGPLNVDEAMGIARQLIDALEAAHERGIIHRDLKPANIKVRDDGMVKILDFGLAKAMDSTAGVHNPGSLANSPTITTPMTQAGLILGTAAYMSPEQAKGRVVDKRSDVWAFGCVLYEMLTGRRAFDGEDVTDTIAAVVRGEPDWNALPADTPPQIRLLLKRSLDKDRRSRIADISVARFLIDETIPAPLPAAPASTRSRRSAIAAAAAGLIIGVVATAMAWQAFTPRPQPAVPARFVFVPPPSQSLIMQGNDRDVAIAPDGSFVVYRSGGSSQTQPALSIRGINELEPRPLPGTVNGRFPFVSPDGRWVAFQAGTEIRKVAVAGGPTIRITGISGLPRGATWGDDDRIVLGTPNGLQQVNANGGELSPLTTVNPDNPEQHVLPHLLPGGKWLVFTSFMGSDYLGARLEALELATGRRKVILPAGQDASYVDSGHLVFGLANAAGDAERRFQTSLRAVRFDPVRVEVIGEPISLVDPVRVGTSPTVNYSVSRRGDLVYVLGSGVFTPLAARTLVWVDRQGRETAIAAEPRTYATARLSPDGTRLALDVRDGTMDVWIWDLGRRTMSALSRHPAQDLSPIWTSDGKRVMWTSTRGGGNPNLYWQASDGTGEAERLTVNSNNQFPTSTTPDGATVVLFGASGNSKNAMDVFTLSLNDPAHKAEPLIAAEGMDLGGEVSPDGKWLAYHSNISGEFQVYVRPFPKVQEGRWQISTAGGTRPAWSRDGRELFYLDRDGLLTSVAITSSAGGTFSPGTPARILNRKYYAGASLLGLDLRAYDISPDGQRFIMIKEPDTPPPVPQTANMV
ncbi:MAG TPA: protein kinase, partial [Vicinamibacterales bacterium]|nr:protein kinase [Vicinamibacterales bacterium]